MYDVTMSDASEPRTDPNLLYAQILGSGMQNLGNAGLPCSPYALYVPRDVQRLEYKRKECEEANDYNRVSSYELSNLLANCQYHIPEMKNLEKVVGDVKFVYGQNFAEFYLMWRQEFERYKFLDSWLNFHASSRESQFQQMRADMMKLFCGRVVIAKWVVDGRWYRAKILSYDKDNNFQSNVYYIDKGNVELQELETLKVIPKEIMKIPSMVFRAALSGHLICPAEAWKRGNTNLEFLLRSTHSAMLICEVITVDTRASSFLATVKLSVPYSLHNNLQLLDINKAVMDVLKVEDKNRKLFSLTDGPLPAEKLILPHNLRLTFPTPNSDVSYYKIKTIKSLRHFYVVEVTDVANQVARDLYVRIHNWSSTERPFDSQKWKIATDRIIDSRIYMHWNSHSKLWDRIQIVRTDTPKQSAFAFFVDNGKFGLVKAEDLREAPLFIFETPARVFRASLAHIKLANSNSNVAAKKDFQALTTGGRFMGVCIGVESVKDPWVSNGADAHSMVLVDTKKVSDRCRKTVQQELCEHHCVKSTGFITGPSRIGVLGSPDARLYDQECLSQSLIDGLAYQEALKPQANAPAWHALNDEGLLTEGYVDMEAITLPQYLQGDPEVHPIYEDSGRVISEEPYFSGQQICRRWSSLPHRTVSYRYKNKVGNRPGVINALKTEADTKTKFVNAFARYIGIGGVTVSHCEGPGVMYLQTLKRISELEKMEKDMSRLFQLYQLHIDYEEIEGAILSGLLCDDSGSRKWHRVFVCKAIPERQLAKALIEWRYKATLCEYIESELIPRIKPSNFTYCRAHLDVKRDCLRQSRWTTRANRQFKEFLSVNKNTTFFPNGSVGRNTEVALMDYGQDVWFDDSELVWYGGGHPRDYPVMPVTCQSQAIFQNLLKSIGVKLWLESESSIPGQLTFENVEDMLH